MAGVALTARSRKPGLSAQGYLLESLLQPSAYLVEGYGPLMPPMGGILTPGEVMVTVAFLESLGGEVAIAPAAVLAALERAKSAAAAGTSTPASGATTQSAGTAPVAAEAGEGEKVFQEICAACHGPDPAVDGPVGPSILGSPTELIQAKVLSGAYPPGYQPKRPSKLMPPMPHLRDKVGSLALFLNK